MNSSVPTPRATALRCSFRSIVSAHKGRCCAAQGRDRQPAAFQGPRQAPRAAASLHVGDARARPRATSATLRPAPLFHRVLAARRSPGLLDATPAARRSNQTHSSCPVHAPPAQGYATHQPARSPASAPRCISPPTPHRHKLPPARSLPAEDARQTTARLPARALSLLPARWPLLPDSAWPRGAQSFDTAQVFLLSAYSAHNITFPKND